MCISDVAALLEGVTKLRLRTTGVSGNQCSAMPGNIVISKTEDKNENATEDERLSNDMVITGSNPLIV